MSTSAKQIAANRANAQKSTGPRTEEGKSVSRQNSTTHGLTGTRCLRTEEEQAAFDAFWLRILPDLNPATELEFELARRIISSMFRLAQVPTIEANMIAAVRFREDAGFDEAIDDLTNAMALGTAFLENGKAFNNLSLYEQRLNRSMHKGLDALRKMQKEAAQRKPATRPALGKPVAQPAASAAVAATSGENGFVFSNRARGRMIFCG